MFSQISLITSDEDTEPDFISINSSHSTETSSEHLCDLHQFFQDGIDAQRQLQDFLKDFNGYF
jgi:hypothetical protein